MANETAYLAGKAIRKIPLAAYAGVAVVAVVAVNLLSQENAPPVAKQQIKVVTSSEQKCRNTLAAVATEASRLLSSGEALAAYNAARPCALATKDPALVEIETRSLMAHKLQVAKNPKEGDAMRMSAIESLERMDTEAAAKLKAIKQQLQANIARKDKEAQRAISKEKRKTGVSVGMTPEDALASSWGKPERINRTTNSRGTSEQWVYPGGEYLYFDNDVLTSISTSR
jgi:hypothetical protein